MENICGDAEASGSLEAQSTGMNQGDAVQEWHLADAAATAALGRWLADHLLAGARVEEAPQPHPPVLLLLGDLGAGKTCLVQGLAEGLGISEPITSPTFALAHHYNPAPSHHGAQCPIGLVHLDLYRLDQPVAADELFHQEAEEAQALGALLAVEWPERLGFRPEAAWWVDLTPEGAGRRARLSRGFPAPITRAGAGTGGMAMDPSLQ
jgi:tRNA threonylcarbamoyladenosine biosynthesis protein TsaE